MKEDQYNAIMRALRNGDRVEIIPIKDGVRILKIKREEIKPNNDTSV